MAALADRVESLETFVNGNGRKGAKSRLDELEACRESQGKRVKDLEDWQHVVEKFITKANLVIGIMTWIGVALGGSVIALIWAILTHAVEIVK